jgi:hypothetical protein
MAARKPGLRVVAPGETPKAPPKPRKLSITEAAEAGDHRQLLAAMRERVAKTVEDPNCPPRDLAALSRRLQEINREIEAIDAKARQEASEDVSNADEAWDAEAL